MYGLTLLTLLAAVLGVDGMPERTGSPSPSEARAGEVIFTPERPRAGERIQVSYRPAATLTGVTAFHLRARIRTAEHDGYNSGMGSVEVARLERGADGVARGTFRLPMDAVYAAFAVETPDASRTDSREGRFWELLVHGDDDRPLLEALEQRFNDHMGRDMSEVLESARAMARLYPEAPLSWSLLHAAEIWGGGTDDEEVRGEEFRVQLEILDRTLKDRAELSGDYVGYMYWYALGLGAEEVAERWRDRLLADHPAHFFAIQERIGRVYREHGNEPEAFLTALEQVWETAESREARRRVLGPGLQFARQTGDPEMIVRWGDRHLEVDPTSAAWIASTLAGTEGIRDEGIRRLREVIYDRPGAVDEDRALGETAAEHEANGAARVAGLRTSLGRALLAAHRVDEAVAELEVAAAVGWNVPRLRSLAEARLAASDSAGATSALAAVAADPSTDAATADSLRATVGATTDAWGMAVESAREAMLARTLAGAREDDVGAPSVLLRRAGATDLTELLGPDATVVVFWSRYCGPSMEAMPRIAEVSAELAAAGIPLLAATRDPPDAAEEYLDENGFDLPVLFDVRGALGQALNNWGTPQYYVLDGAGRLRFVSSLDALMRHTMALRESR